jgi:hypothetical protein
MYKRIAESSCEVQRRLLQAQAWDLRKRWVDAWKTRSLRDDVAKGRVFSRSKKLHHLESLVEDTGICTYDATKLEAALHKHFGGKWGARNAEGRAQLLEHLLESDGTKLNIPCESLHDAFMVVRQKRRLDKYGVSVGALLLILRACPAILIEFLRSFIASASMVSSIEVVGRVLGKESSVSPVNKLRAILPIPALMQLVDALCPHCWQFYLVLLGTWWQAGLAAKCLIFPMLFNVS